MNLRRKYILVLGGFALFLTLGGGWLSWTLTAGALEDQMDEKLLWVAGSAAEVGLEGRTLLGFTQPADSIEVLFSSQQARLERLQRYVDEAWVFRRDNTVIASSASPTALPIGTPLRWLDAYVPELDRAWSVGEAVTPAFTGEDGRFYKYAFHRLEDTDAMLAVLAPADFLSPLARFQQTLALGALTSGILAAILATLLATNIVRPLERLSRVALRIQRGRWDREVQVERGDELGRLSRAMERMRKGLIQRDEQLRLMLAQVAHEIRNPLGGLELFASAAMDTEDRDERRRLLSRVRSEIQGLNGIINDFLSFARPLHAETRLHDLRHPIGDALDMVRLGFQKNGDTLEVHLPETPLMGRADPDHVKRVVLNLLQNAAHAGDGIRLSAWWYNGEVVVAVADDGPGVSTELRERIFEPFFTDKEQGAGLGLAIVHRLMEVNGGRVELANGSGPADPWPSALGGAGAEFRLYFSGSDDLPP
ncbi:MAG: sensor histidine kinase [Gemmatimonadales bacterium]|nr:MAG: sensor histidine kinase [Gemmatimonadales bacterium]